MRRKAVAKERKTLAYVRVSTTEQAENGHSLDAQRERLASYAIGAGREPIHEFIVDDGYSGGTLERPGMQRLIALVQAGEVDAILVTKLDRLSRSLRDVLNLLDLCERTGTALCSASESLDTSSAAGRMVVHLLASFGEFERGRIGERTAEVLAYKRNAKKVYGPTPYGFTRDDDRLIPDERQQAALAMIRQLDANGQSLRSIAKALTEAGYQPPKGAAWHATSVRNILLSKMATEVAA